MSADRRATSRRLLLSRRHAVVGTTEHGSYGSAGRVAGTDAARGACNRVVIVSSHKPGKHATAAQSYIDVIPGGAHAPPTQSTSLIVTLLRTTQRETGTVIRAASASLKSEDGAQFPCAGGSGVPVDQVGGDLADGGAVGDLSWGVTVRG
jgi:hypothetical protein